MYMGETGFVALDHSVKPIFTHDARAAITVMSAREAILSSRWRKECICCSHHHHRIKLTCGSHLPSRSGPDRPEQ
jgi:hypothetical protein